MNDNTQIDQSPFQKWDEEYYAHVFMTRDEYQSVVITAVEDDHVILEDGTRLLDLTSGLLCVNSGQRNPVIRDAIVEALDRFGFVAEVFATPYRAKAAKLIMQDVLGPDDWAGRIRFTSSGSEANELAMLVAKTVTGRPNIISRDFAYHGWTHGALSAMGLPGSRGIMASPDGEVRRPPGIPIPGVHFAPAPYCRRCPIGHTYPACKRGGDRLACIDATEHLIRTLGADTVAAIIAEPIFGVGMIHPPKEYLGQLREMTRDYGILWIDDEIMTGFGRTGKWFAYQHADGVVPDLMTIGKGVASAALPVGGMVMSRQISAQMDDYRWETISTYAGHPVVMAAVAASVEWMISNDLPGQAAEKGQLVADRLGGLVERHPSVDQAQGVGMLWAIELIRPDGSGEPFVADDRHAIPTGREMSPSQFVVQEAFKRGALLAPGSPNTLRFGPSLAIKEATLEEGLGILDAALTELDGWGQ